jgi:hypothetical protein
MQRLCPDGERGCVFPTKLGDVPLLRLIDLIEETAVAEMNRLRFLPASEGFIDRKERHLWKLLRVLRERLL